MTSGITFCNPTPGSIVNESKSVSSWDEFNGKYSVYVDDGIINVAERTTNVVLAKLTTKKDEEQYGDVYNSSHFHNGIYYFALSSERYTLASYVYSFDLSKKSIKFLLSVSQPEFFENRIVDFGSGFSRPGYQVERFANNGGRATLKIYDLTQPIGKMQIDLINLTGGWGQGWQGRIDEENKMVEAFDHNGEGGRYSFPLFKKV